MVSTPDMFGSEVCIYLDKDYYQKMITPSESGYETKNSIVGRSLAREWNLSMPDGFGEIGIRVFIPDGEDGDYCGEWWFLGEVAPARP